MDKFSLMVPNFIPAQEYFDPQHGETCIGCGVSLAARLVGKALEKSCAGAVCERRSGADLFGVKTDAAFMRIKKGKAELIICFDDEPSNALQDALVKKLPAVAVAEGIAYVATACPSYPFDLMEKVKRAMDADGSAYIHILTPCPSAWQYPTENTVKVGFKAVESCAFPLYEVASGFYNLTNTTLKPRSVEEYIRAQGRFEKATDAQVKSAAATVEKEYKKLLEKAQPE
jgi:pyruvate/2-oxoacid:ferredoxin oxidoreductase beta subunit